jgi:acetyltransferase-like isoleucine patch superfamily enzyme
MSTESPWLIDPAQTRIGKNVHIAKTAKIMPWSNIYDSVIGENVFIGPFVELGGVKIGDWSRISSHCYACPGVEIGEHCFIGHGVMFSNDLYTTPLSYKHIKDLSGTWELRKTRVGNRVRIGSGAVILPVDIGDDCVIGAGAVVTGNVPAGTTVFGNPARISLKRTPD